jgi:hypothetical protein
VRRAISHEAINAWLARVLDLVQPQEPAEEGGVAYSTPKDHTGEQERRARQRQAKEEMEDAAVEILLEGLEVEIGQGQEVVVKDPLRHDAVTLNLCVCVCVKVGGWVGGCGCVVWVWVFVCVSICIYYIGCSAQGTAGGADAKASANTAEENRKSNLAGGHAASTHSQPRSFL